MQLFLADVDYNKIDTFVLFVLLLGHIIQLETTKIEFCNSATT